MHVQRVNDGAIAQRLPVAWQRSHMFVVGWSADGPRRATRAGWSPPVRALAAWPRAVRIRSEPLDRPPLGHAHVLEPSLSRDYRSALGAAARPRPEGRGEALSGTPRIRPGHPSQEDQAWRSLHQGTDGRAMAGPLEEVAFLVARRPHRGSRATAVCPWIRRRASEASGNLLRCAALAHVCPDLLPQPGDQEGAWPSRLTGPDRLPPCVPCRPDRVGPSSRRGQLATHGAGSPPHHRCHCPATNGRGPSCPGARSQGLRHSGVCRDLVRRATPAHPGLKCWTGR